MKSNIESLLLIFRLVIIGFLCYNLNKVRLGLALFGVYGEDTMRSFKSFKTRKVFGIEDVLSYNREKEIRMYNLELYQPSQDVLDREYDDKFKFKSLFGMYYVMVSGEMVVIWADFVDTHNASRRSSESQLLVETSTERASGDEPTTDDGVSDSESVQATRKSKKAKIRAKRAEAKVAIENLGPEAAAAGIRLEAVHDPEEDESEEEDRIEDE